jgi:hypothetical protein
VVEVLESNLLYEVAGTAFQSGYLLLLLLLLLLLRKVRYTFHQIPVAIRRDFSCIESRWGAGTFSGHAKYGTANTPPPGTFASTRTYLEQLAKDREIHI